MKPQYGPDPKHDVIMLVGIDPSEELPVLDLHLKRAVRLRQRRSWSSSTRARSS